MATPSAAPSVAKAVNRLVPFVHGSDADQQAVLFYMYGTDVADLCRYLLSHGVCDGGRYTGAAAPGDVSGMVFDIAHPDYMPAGEIRILDPDGYVILVGQLQ